MAIVALGGGLAAILAIWVIARGLGDMRQRGTTDPLEIETSGFEVGGSWRVDKTVGTVGDTDFTVQGWFKTEEAGVKRDIIGNDAETGLPLYVAVHVPKTTFPPKKDRHDWRAAEVIKADDLSLQIGEEMITYSDAETQATERYEFRRDAAEDGGGGVDPIGPSDPTPGGDLDPTPGGGMGGGGPSFSLDGDSSPSVSAVGANTLEGGW
jgi:hypothetical protein